MLHSIFPGEFSMTYQNDCGIIELKTLKEHWIKFKGKIDFLIYAHFRLYVTVVFKVTIVGIVRRHYNHRVNATAYREQQTENLVEEEISPLLIISSTYWRLSYFLYFTQALGLI